MFSECAGTHDESFAVAGQTGAAEWADIVDRYGLDAPRDMPSCVGNSWSYADILFGSLGARPLRALLSTIKICRAGFHDCIDTADMFRFWFAKLQAQRRLPSVLLQPER